MDFTSNLDQVLTDLKLEAAVERCHHNPPYLRFWLRLNPRGTVRKIEAAAREIGLRLRCGEPIVRADFATGCVCLEMMAGEHPLVPFRQLARMSGFIDSSTMLSKYQLPILVGTVNVREPLIVDLAEFPHILLAGTTGSGKSVAEHCCIRSLDLHAEANRVKLVLCDPKFVEFTKYSRLDSLLYPVSAEPNQIEANLEKLCLEMDDRLHLLNRLHCRDYQEYRRKTGRGHYIVAVIDELSDLMATTRGRFEDALCRLAQKARAAGIHLVVATQYPRSDIMTGAIKANFAGRICFQTTDPAHSRVMLGDSNSSAVLLQGRGDGYLSGGGFSMQRFRGAMVDFDEELGGGKWNKMKRFLFGETAVATI